MNFNSLTFLVFFFSVSVLFFALPQRFKWVLLLVASYVFYASWNLKYSALMLVTTATSWIGGMLVARTSRVIRKKMVLLACLTVNLGILAIFKYHVLIAETANALLSGFYSSPEFEPLDVLLPVGISFYTFQAIGYVIDVYRDDEQLERHFGYFALYISFFPQLVAGPIERARNILPQLRQRFRFDFDRVGDGLALAMWGFFKKLVIADRVGLYVDAVYASPSEFSPIQVCLATLFFSFQIYCDFSGYTDIARGVAKVFGIDLMKNFNRPYFANSFQDFWRRWHISLSTWFRDYVYIPLGGSRRTVQRTLLNVLIVFAICGLWHGASWNFVIWGLVHALLLCLGLLVGRLFPVGEAIRSKWFVKLSKILLVFTLVTLAWIPFRAETLGDVLIVLEKIAAACATPLAGGGQELFPAVKAFLISLSPNGEVELHEVFLGMVFIMFLLTVEMATRKKGFLEAYKTLLLIPRWACFYFLFYSTMVFGQLGIAEFVYFQF